MPPPFNQCADPTLKPAIVEKFIRAVGAPDPLAVTVRTGNRVSLVMPPKTADDAMELVRRYVGQAMVRVGVTQYPAGLGATDVAELKPDLVDACANIGIGTALFGKVYRFVTNRYGAPVDEAFRAAIDAWKTGYFDGKDISTSPIPATCPPARGVGREHWRQARRTTVMQRAVQAVATMKLNRPGGAGRSQQGGIQIDLAGIGVSNPK